MYLGTHGLVAVLVTDRDASLIGDTFSALSRTIAMAMESGLSSCDLGISLRSVDRRARLESISHRPRHVRHMAFHVDDYEVQWVGKHQTDTFKAICTQRNTMLRRAREGDYDWLLFLDSDVVMHPDTLGRLLAVPGPVVHAPYRPRWAAHPMVGVKGDNGTIELLLNPHLHVVDGPGFPVAFVAAGCTLIRREAMDVLFQVDDYLFVRGEDLGFCKALRARGQTPWCLANASVEHRCQASDGLFIPFISDTESVQLTAAKLAQLISGPQNAERHHVE